VWEEGQVVAPAEPGPLVLVKVCVGPLLVIDRRVVRERSGRRSIKFRFLNWDLVLCGGRVSTRNYGRAGVRYVTCGTGEGMGSWLTWLGDYPLPFQRKAFGTW